jgi:predicted dehydrogenase
VRLGIVGCGYVADLYLATLRGHPRLELAGAVDRLPERTARFCAHWGVPSYRSVEELLADRSVDAVVNLTNPGSHFAVSEAAIRAGKHVYSEKPLAMELEQARRLVALAEERGVVLSSAPSNLLGGTAQTLWRALREEAVGPVRAVYAELDDGMLHRMPYRRWTSASGTPWPWQDELEVGCTLEHAGYYLTWLAAFFGPAESVTAFSSCQIPDKQTDLPLRVASADFSVACLRFRSGVAARLTCGIVAPHDHRLRVVGDLGVLGVEDCWDTRAPVRLRRLVALRRRVFLSPFGRRCRPARAPGPRLRRRGPARMDFCAGLSEMAEAVEQRRTPRLSARFALHVNELALAISGAGAAAGAYRTTTTFDPVEPMPWAR